MARSDPADRVRLRVRGAVEIQRSGAGPSDTTGCGRAVCAVGEIDKGNGVESVVWIRGGSQNHAAQIYHDTCSDLNWIDVELSTLRVKPSTLSDEEALSADDIAAVIHSAKIVESNKLHNLAVFTTSKTAATAYAFVKILRDLYDQTEESRPIVRIVFMDGIVSDAVNSSSQTTPRALSHDDEVLKDSLKLDGCLDLCCSDSSLELATRHVEPLGTVILLPPTAQDSASAIAVNMNAVVVNELVLVNVGDYREDLPRALAFLADQPAF